MIKINSTLHTKRGVTINSGSILCVKPHFLDPIKIYDGSDIFERILYNISYDVKLFKSMNVYKEKGSMSLTNEQLVEFNIAFEAKDVDIKSLTSVDGLLQLLQDHIENGDESFSGVGVSNTEIVYP